MCQRIGKDRSIDTERLKCGCAPEDARQHSRVACLISEYRVAAQKGADRKVSPGPDASKDTSIAIGVGATLKECGIVPDAKPKGIFVISTAIVFEVMDIHKSEARNAVRRALKSLQQSAIGKLI